MFRKPLILALSLLALAALACRAASKTGSPAENPAVEGELSGKRVFQQMGCAECHNSVMAVAAPALDGVYGSQVELQGGETVVADEAYLRESILSPGDQVVAGYQPIMPDFSGQLSEAEVEALVSYIRALGE